MDKGDLNKTIRNAIPAYRTPSQHNEEFGERLRRYGEAAVNYRTGAMFVSIMKGICRDFRNGFQKAEEPKSKRKILTRIFDI